jgi:nucleoside-diphosphate-sugar epimerase
MNIFLTGSAGFIGTSVIKYFGEENIQKYKRNQNIHLDNERVIIHLAGKSTDSKITANSDEYYLVNTDFTKEIFDKFLHSDAEIFIFLSSVKAAADEIDCDLTEDHNPNPQTHYGKSKLLAEQYILSKQIPANKRIYVLRPCIIHGPGNKGNLTMLYNFVRKSIPWPLAAFSNKRSYCSIDNLLFVLKELIERADIPSGIYNIADDDPVSTNEIIKLMSQSSAKKPRLWSISQRIIRLIARVGDVLNLPLNTERLQKLTESYIVSNKKLKQALGKKLPVTSTEGLIITFDSFKL